LYKRNGGGSSSLLHAAGLCFPAKTESLSEGAIMRAKKVVLLSVGGFFLMGALALPFIPKMTPEQDLASGKRYLASQCADVTRNRKINGHFGRGPAYCDCIGRSLNAGLRSGDEYRYAARIHTAGGAERMFFVRSRIRASMERAMKEFAPRVGRPRMIELNRMIFANARSCARSM